ncbi:MAG: MarR family winged helix-turn-helix transcriptional regulator [Shimia sp.]
MADDLATALGIDHIGVDLWSAARAYEAAMFAAIARAGFDDLTLADSTVLALIGPNGARAAEIARSRAISKQAMQEQIGRLIARGYLESAPDPQDGRAKRLFLSQRGTEMAHAFVAIKQELDGRLQHALGRKNYSMLRASLGEVKVVLSP